jgi:hypothetical protein
VARGTDYYCIDGAMQSAVLLALPMHGGEIGTRESPEQMESLHAPAVVADVEESLAVEAQRRMLLRTAYVSRVVNEPRLWCCLSSELCVPRCTAVWV